MKPGIRYVNMRNWKIFSFSHMNHRCQRNLMFIFQIYNCAVLTIFVH